MTTSNRVVRLSRRRALAGGLLALGALPIVAACSGQAPASPTAPVAAAAATPSGSVNPKPGQTSVPAASTAAAPTPSTKAPAAAPTTAPAAATGPSSASSGKIIYMHWFTSALPGGKAQAPVLDAFTKAFPAIKVDSQPTPGGNSYYQKLLTMMAGGVPPDAFTLALNELAPLQGKSALAPLDDFASQSGSNGLDKQDIVPGILEAASLQGHLYGLPMNLDTQAMYYNTDLFKKAGVGTPTADWSWENEWLKAAEALTTGSGAQKQFGAILPPWQIIIWANGGDILSSDEKKCVMDQAPATQAIQFLEDLRFKYHVAPQVTDLQTENSNDLFNTGRVGMNFSQSSQIGRLVVTWKAKVPWEVAPLPKGSAGPANVMTFTSLGIAKSSKSAQDAWTFNRFLVSPESVKLWVQTVSWVFMYKSTLSIQSPLFKPGQAKIFLDAAANAHTEPRISNYSQILDVINKEMGVAVNEGKEPAQAATTAIVKEVNPLLT